MAQTSKARQFTHEHGSWALEDEGLPAEAAIAYEESWVRERVAANGLALSGDPVPGWWSGDSSGRAYQDVIVAERPVAGSAGATGATGA